MNAETVHAALAALPCTVVRGADRGLPPPTLSYALQRDREGWQLTLKLRAALCEQHDGLAAQAEQMLKPMGFLLRGTREGEEKDTGIKTAEMVMALFESPDITMEESVLAGCRAVMTEQLPSIHSDLGGAWRRVGESALTAHVTAPLGMENAAAQRLLNAGAEGVPLCWAGKRYTAYAVRKERLFDRTELYFALKEENA